MGIRTCIGLKYPTKTWGRKRRKKEKKKVMISFLFFLFFFIEFFSSPLVLHFFSWYNNCFFLFILPSPLLRYTHIFFFLHTTVYTTNLPGAFYLFQFGLFHFVSCSWKTDMHESSRHNITYHMYLFFILRSTVYRVHHYHCYHTEYNIGWPIYALWYHALFLPGLSLSFLVCYNSFVLWISIHWVREYLHCIQ